jgi:hypothetical protein
MSGFRFWACLVLAILSLLLPSCIDGHEEVWIEANGSGRAEITYSIPARAVQLKGGDKAVAEMIRSFLADTTEISQSTCEVLTEGDTTRICVRTTFDSALDLKNTTEGPGSEHLPPAAKHLAGVVATTLEGRSLDFTRTIQPGKAMPGSSLLPNSTYQGHHLTYIIHLPAVPGTHNATRTENGGRTLIWEKNLKEAIRAPIITHFRMDVPIPWKWIAPICVCLGLLAILAARMLRKRSP